MKFISKKILNKVGLGSLLFAATTGVALAAGTASDAGQIAQRVSDQMDEMSSLLSGIAYIAGIGFGIKGALKLKEHNESKGQVPLSTPIFLFIVAAILVALPSLLTTSATTIWGDGAYVSTGAGSGSQVGDMAKGFDQAQ